MTSVGIMASGVVVSSAVDVLLEPFNDFTTNSWTNSGCAIVAGRTGTAADATSTDEAVFTIPAPNVSDYLTVGFAFRTSTIAAQYNIIRLDVTGVIENRFVLNTDGSVAVGRGSGSTITGATSTASQIAINTWYYLELQLFSHTSVGTVTVRKNGVAIIAAGPTNTRGANTPNQLVLDTGSGATHLYDDLYLTTGAGAAFKGDITVPGGVVVYSDDFNRADSTNTMGADWSAGWSIFSNTARRGNTDYVRYQTAMPSTDHWIEAFVTRLSGTQTLTLRGPNANSNCYQGFMRGDGTAEIGKTVSGTYTSLVLGTTGLGTTAHTARFECEGTALRFYRNGVLVASITDSTFTTGTYVGFICTGATSNVDNFRAGPLPYTSP
jgi:hypothetical protein